MKPEQGEVDGAAFFAEERLAWTEKQFQSALLAAYCGTKKEPLPAGIAWKPYHTFFSENSMAGWPDVVLVRNGRMVIAELKSETGKVRPEQVECLELLRQVEAAIASPAFRVFEWRPSSWGEIAEVLA